MRYCVIYSFLEEGDKLKMNNHFISVLMPCYKEPLSYVVSAIESVLSQTYRNWELLLLLDDPSNSELLEIGRQYEKRDSRITLHVNKKNLGLVESLNNGLLLAKGDIIARLDADDIAARNRFELQIRLIEEYDVVSSNFAFINMEGEIIKHRSFPEKHEDVAYYLKNIADCMYHTTWMVKKNVYMHLGGYRAIGPFEDYDFLLRAIKAGYRMYNCPDELALYRVNPNGISSTNKILQHLGSEYLRENFDKLDKITNEEIIEYIHSEKGEYKSKEYKKFYAVTSRLYSSKNILEYFGKLVIYGPYIAIFTYYGRKKVFQKIFSRKNTICK